MSAPLPITPETRVAELLEAYPALEEVLVASAPAFRKLRNPVLRRTIARVTSLERAAQVAGIPVRDLVLELRTAAGLGADVSDVEDDADDGPDQPADWVDPGRVQWTVDADALLADDRQPITEVMQRAASLEGDQLGMVRSSFRPAPLLDMLSDRGFRTAVVESWGSYATFVGRSGA